MMFRRFDSVLPCLAFACLLLLPSKHGLAAIIVRFDKPIYEAIPGGTFDVKLIAAVTGSSVGLLNTGGADGLFSIGVRVLNSSNLAQVISPTQITISPLFNDFLAGNATRQASATSAAVTAITTDVLEGIQVGVGDPLFAEIATFTYNMSNLPGGPMTLSLADYNSFDNSLTVNGLALDNPMQIDFSATATVTAVPEPSAFGLLGLGVCVGFCRRNRRA